MRGSIRHIARRRAAVAFVVAAGVAALSAAPAIATTEPPDPSGGAVDVQAELDALLARPTQISQTEPFEGEIPTDVKIVWIQCSVPACIALGGPLQEAIDVLGWELVVITHDGTPEGVKDAYGQAIREEPDGVVSSGYPRQMFDPELEQLAAAGTAVVMLTVTDPPGGGITAVVNGPERNAEVGRQLATFVTADSGGTASAVWVTSTFPILVPELEGVEGEGGFAPTMEAVCSDCSFETLEIPIDALATQAPQRIVAYLQANPDVDYVVGAFGDIVTALPGALADAGLADRVKIATYSQNETISLALQEGDIDAVIGFPGPENMWQVADTFLRVLTDQPYDEVMSDLPSWIITGETVPSTTEFYPLVEDYQDQYRALWGIA